MRVVDAWLLKRSILKFKTKISKALIRDYGKLNYYSISEVENSIHRLRLGSQHSIYAIGMYCTSESFNSYCENKGIKYNYELIRKDICEVLDKGGDDVKQEDFFPIQNTGIGGGTDSGSCG